MEIEAKYTLPDRSRFDLLRTLVAAGPYQLRTEEQRLLIDHYLDTTDRFLMKQGYALRLREQPGRPLWRAALKGLGGAQGAVHRREEHEVDVTPGALPAAWPAGPVRDLALRLLGQRQLVELVAIRQERHCRPVWRDDRLVGELVLDAVVLNSQADLAPTYELEIELGPDGTDDDLTLLAAQLAPYDLRPQLLSKFERALATVPPGAAPA